MNIYDPYDFDITHWYDSLSGGVIAVYWCLLAVSIAAMWILFQKAHEEGWASIVPFYNCSSRSRISSSGSSRC